VLLHCVCACVVCVCGWQGQYFLVRDVGPDDDKLGTLQRFLAPNVSEASHGFPVYGLGQPTLNGITDFVQGLKDRGKQVQRLRRCKLIWGKMLKKNVKTPLMLN